MKFNVEKYLYGTDRDSLLGLFEYLRNEILPRYGINLEISASGMSDDELHGVVKKYLTPELIRFLCDEGDGMFLTNYFTEDLDDGLGDYFRKNPKKEATFYEAEDKWYDIDQSFEDETWRPDLSDGYVRKIVETITGIKV